MLDLRKTRVTLSATRHLPSLVVVQEGAALVAFGHNAEGEVVVRPSTGAENEVFAGVSITEINTPDFLPLFQVVVAEGTTLELPREPIPGTLRLVDGATVLEEGDAAEAGKYSISGKVVTLHSGQANHSITVQLSYVPHLAELYQWQGHNAPGNHVSQELARTGVVEGGEVYTTMFDTSCDWSDVSAIRLGANGLFTTEGTGTPVECVVVQKPTDGDLCSLGLNFNVSAKIGTTYIG